jgi:hypothetical protein
MQRDYYMLGERDTHNNASLTSITSTSASTTSSSSSSTFRVQNDDPRTPIHDPRGVPIHEAERAIRERYLDERNRNAPKPTPDFASPLPPPPPHHYAGRWSSRGLEPSSLMSPESPEDVRPIRHPPSPLLLKKSEPKPESMNMQHHYTHPGEGQQPPQGRPELSPAAYQTYIPPHYRYVLIRLG